MAINDASSAQSYRRPDAVEPATGSDQHAARRPPASPPPPPRTPSARARRLIFAYQGSQKVLLIIGLAFLAMGLPMALLFTWGVPVDLLLAFDHRVVTGRLLGAELDYSTTINDRHPLVIRFAYVVDGHSLEGRSSTTDYQEAGELPADLVVEVATVAPDLARLRGTTYNSFGYVPLFTLLFPIVGAGLLFSAVRSNRREIRAFVHGRPTTARVVFAGPDTSTTINGRHPFKVEWEFRVADQVFGGSLSNMRQLELEDLSGVPEITVLYDPDDPRINTAYIS